MLAGLMHDIGKLYILTRVEAYPALFGDRENFDALLSAWHTGVGRAIVELWGFPEPIATAVDEHEELARSASTAIDLADVVLVANLLSHRGEPRYEVIYRSSTAWPFKKEYTVKAHNVVFSAGVLGTLQLLFKCRDVTGSLPKVSQKLGELVRTNSEALMGVIHRDDKVNYSEGIAMTSIVQADEVTRVEPVRYPDGSSVMRFISAPLIYALF